jgi:chemotaxis protein histidine kinase CheA
MARKSEFSVIGRQYAEGTRERMARVIRGLLTIEGDCRGRTEHLVRQIQEQEAASRRSGCERIARLCQSMEDCLTGIDRGEQPRLEPIVTTLVEVCQAISQHAVGLLETIRRCRREAPRETTAAVAAGSTAIGNQVGR